jgi:hypothetical protein
MKTPITISDELYSARRLTVLAREKASFYSVKPDQDAATLALLATALEQECLSQGINPTRLKFFTNEVLE